MSHWMQQLKYDPIKPLLESGNPAVAYFTKRDLLDQDVGTIERIWNLPEVSKIVKKQRQDGSWDSGKRESGSILQFRLLETWKQFRFLVDQYELNNNHESVRKAAEFIFSCQSDEGDFRGILANQYTPYYTGAILSLLIKAGYQDDRRILKGIRWLLDIRQNDGGWVIGSPGLINRTSRDINFLTSNWTEEPERDFDKSKPFSAAGTGMAIRGLAAHPVYRKSAETTSAAMLLKSKFFKKDNWSSYEHPDHWIRFQFPYWWNHLISALDALSLIGIPGDDKDIQTALQWLIDHQQNSGLWKTSYSKIHKNAENNQTYEMQLWISLSICRILKRYSESTPHKGDFSSI